MNTTKKMSKSPVIQYITKILNESKKGLTRAEILDLTLKNVNTKSITVSTYLTDGFNARYCMFPNLLKKDAKTGLITISNSKKTNK